MNKAQFKQFIKDRFMFYSAQAMEKQWESCGWYRVEDIGVIAEEIIAYLFNAEKLEKETRPHLPEVAGYYQED